MKLRPEDLSTAFLFSARSDPGRENKYLIRGESALSSLITASPHGFVGGGREAGGGCVGEVGGHPG